MINLPVELVCRILDIIDEENRLPVYRNGAFSPIAPHFLSLEGKRFFARCRLVNKQWRALIEDCVPRSDHLASDVTPVRPVRPCVRALEVTQPLHTPEGAVDATIAQEVASRIRGLEHLETLLLSGFALAPPGPAIASCLSQCKTIRHLAIHAVNDNGQQGSSNPPFGFTLLTRLSAGLRALDIAGPGFFTLRMQDAILAMPSLKVLSLGPSLFYEPRPTPSDQVPQTMTLEELYLCQRYMPSTRSDGTIAAAALLNGNHKTLRTISMDGNFLEGILWRHSGGDPLERHPIIEDYPNLEHFNLQSDTHGRLWWVCRLNTPRLETLSIEGVPSTYGSLMSELKAEGGKSRGLLALKRVNVNLSSVGRQTFNPSEQTFLKIMAAHGVEAHVMV